MVGDLLNGTQVQGPDGGIVNYPVWPTLTREGFNPNAPPTAQLNSMLVIEAGSLKQHAGSKLTFTPLVGTSPVRRGCGQRGEGQFAAGVRFQTAGLDHQHRIELSRGQELVLKPSRVRVGQTG